MKILHLSTLFYAFFCEEMRRFHQTL